MTRHPLGTDAARPSQEAARGTFHRRYGGRFRGAQALGWRANRLRPDAASWVRRWDGSAERVGGRSRRHASRRLGLRLGCLRRLMRRRLLPSLVLALAITGIALIPRVAVLARLLLIARVRR